MKTSLLILFSLIVIIATGGCLKDSDTHVNEVNVSLTGTWAQNTATLTYFDNNGSQVYTTSAPKQNLQFDGKSTVYIATDTSSVTGSYNITTSAAVDYVNLTGSINHNYQIVALHSRDLTLLEKLNYPQGDTIISGGIPKIYNYTVQVNAYTKNDLPMN